MAFYSINDPTESYTLKQFIRLRDIDNLTYYKYSILERSLTNSELVYAIDNVIYTYMPELKNLCKIVTVDISEKIKYAYKPKLLSYDIYGSVEIYFVLLALNGKCNLKEFDLEEGWFYAVKPNDLSSIMTRIYNSEDYHITLNRKAVNVSDS